MWLPDPRSADADGYTIGHVLRSQHWIQRVKAPQATCSIFMRAEVLQEPLVIYLPFLAAM